MTASAPSGFLSILLHAHLPYVRHPEYEDPLEERWLVEALFECYLPLLGVLERRADRGARGRITLSLSPTLIAMLDDDLIRGRLAHRLARLEDLAARDVHRHANEPALERLSRHYLERFREGRRRYEDTYRRDVVGAFASLEKAGVVSLVTCGATHGFLPLMDMGAPSWRAQIGTAARDFERRLGHGPEGMWLPECGYTPGVESILAEFGVGWFVVDAHGIANACPRPLPGTYAPFRTGSGVLALGRDVDASRQVWSATEGYPGDPEYREYYRDQGFDLPMDEVRSDLPSGGTRTHLGLKYHRITDRRFEHRELYDPDRARERAVAHASHFVRAREVAARRAARAVGQPCLVLAPYDAELFGHWWYEGPEWLDLVLDRVAESGDLEAVSATEAAARIPRAAEGRLFPSSWGAEGYSSVWLDPSNDWIYRHLLRASERMASLAREGDRGDGLRGRALRQAGREVLLAQASDWAFIMKTGTLVPYAHRRTEEHLERFGRLDRALTQGPLDEPEVAAMEARYPIFPSLDPGLFA